MLPCSVHPIIRFSPYLYLSICSSSHYKRQQDLTDQAAWVQSTAEGIDVMAGTVAAWSFCAMQYTTQVGRWSHISGVLLNPSHADKWWCPALKSAAILEMLAYINILKTVVSRRLSCTLKLYFSQRRKQIYVLPDNRYSWYTHEIFICVNLKFTGTSKMIYLIFSALPVITPRWSHLCLSQ